MGKVNWKSALLEIILIVIGISIAFALDNWKDSLKLKQIEIKTLKEIQEEMKHDLVDMNNNHLGHESVKNSDEIILEFFEKDLPYHDSLKYHFPNQQRTFVAIRNTAAYETLKSRGLDIITNDSLRLQITRVYDFDYEILEKLEESFYPAQSFQHFFPFFKKHFKNYNSGIQKGTSYKRSAEPIDYEALKHNEEYLIILENDKLWRYFILEQYYEIMPRIDSLVHNIDQEILRLQ